MELWRKELYSNIAYKQNYLSHHGVKGMRWGHRKEYISTPRIPGSRNNSSSGSDSKKKASIKRKVKIGLAVAGGVLVAAGGIAVAKAVSNKRMQVGRNFLERKMFLNYKNRGYSNSKAYMLARERYSKLSTSKDARRQFRKTGKDILRGRNPVTGQKWQVDPKRSARRVKRFYSNAANVWANMPK